MNRREAIAALTAMPGLTSVEVADVKADDVLVFEVNSHVTDEMVDRLKATAEGIWPGRRIVVLADNIKLKVVRG
jgi:hypothetical protein